MVDINSRDDMIDTRDVITVIEALEDARGTGGLDEVESSELARLSSLMSDLKGNGGDAQWRDGWYPVTLIRDSYFECYARELAEDIGAVKDDYSWPASHIDWTAAAEALQMDYSAVEFDGVTYWYR